MSEEILVRQGAPTLAGIKTGSLFPCPCEDHEALMTDIRQLNRRLTPKGLCLLPLRFLPVLQCLLSSRSQLKMPRSLPAQGKLPLTFSFFVPPHNHFLRFNACKR